jgi:hypothetical protein
LSLNQEIVALKDELKNVLEVRGKCDALAAEVAALRQALEALKKDIEAPSITARAAPRPPKRTYAAVTGSETNGNLSSSTAQNKPMAGADRRAKTTSKQNIEARVKVIGARRIWGTLKTCSPGAVSATISKLIPTRVALKIKRKTKRLGNKTVWWFVVHGSEKDLTMVEQAWDKVQSQTLWTIQDCYMPADSQNVSENLTNHTPSQNAPDTVTVVMESPVTGSDDTSCPSVTIADNISKALPTISSDIQQQTLPTVSSNIQQQPSTPACSKAGSFLEPSQSPVHLLLPG